MQVTTLEDAERIVKRNPMLEWDGWTICHVRKNNAAWMQKNGSFRNGKWYRILRYAPDRNGWSLPDKYVRQTMLYDWKDKRCSNVDVNMFFDYYENDVDVAKSVDAMCASCPRQAQCLAAGVSKDEYGVWGGVYLEKGELSREFNKHKTNDDWFKIWSNATMGR